MAIIVASHRKDVKMLACHKIKFQSVAQEECLAPIWKYVEDENGEKDYSETGINLLILQNCLIISKMP